MKAVRAWHFPSKGRWLEPGLDHLGITVNLSHDRQAVVKFKLRVQIGASVLNIGYEI